MRHCIHTYLFSINREGNAVIAEFFILARRAVAVRLSTKPFAKYIYSVRRGLAVWVIWRFFEISHIHTHYCIFQSSYWFYVYFLKIDAVLLSVRDDCSSISADRQRLLFAGHESLFIYTNLTATTHIIYYFNTQDVHLVYYIIYYAHACSKFADNDINYTSRRARTYTCV